MILTVGLNPTFQKTLVFSEYIADTVNRAAEHRLDTAGKGINVCRVLTQLGKDCIYLSQLGGSMRPLFLEMCAGDGIQIEWVESRSPIRFCYTVIDRNNSSVTELVEESQKVDEHTGERLLEALDRLLACGSGSSKITALIVSGSKAAGFNDNLLSEIVRRTRGKGIPVILDIRGRDLLLCLPFEPDIIKPNLYEFASTFAADLVSGNEIRVAGPEGIAAIKNRTAEICHEIQQKYRTKIILSRV